MSVAEARRLLAAASPAERWEADSDAGDDGERFWAVGPGGTEAQAGRDVALLRAAPRLLGDLADECERLRAERDAAKAAATCVHGASPQLCAHCQRAFALKGGHG